jgi:hypothetical protein
VAAQFAKKNNRRNNIEKQKEKDGTQEVTNAQILACIIIPWNKLSNHKFIISIKDFVREKKSAQKKERATETFY